MILFVAFCKYDGCEECGQGGAHILGIFTTEEKAQEICDKHQARARTYANRDTWGTLSKPGPNPAHYGHYFDVNVEEFHLDTEVEDKW